MGFKDFYDAATTIIAKRKSAMAWVLRRRWATVGFFTLICTLLAMLYVLTVNYYEYKNHHRATLQLDEAHWKDMEIRYNAIIDSTNLCISEPKDSENRSWYCNEALNRYRAELPLAPLNPRITRILEQEAYPLILIDTKIALNRMGWERIMYAEPDDDAQVFKQLLKWTWVYVVFMIATGLAWLFYVNRYRQLRERDVLTLG